MKKPLSEMPNKWNKSHQIYTNDIESQIWFAFENLSGLQYLDSIIKKRINDDYVKNLTNSVVQNIKKKDAKRAELIEPLKDENVPYVLDEARNVILQSKDIYFAARPLSLLSKPIPLFYSFEKLAEFLYFLTYRKGKYTHGLVYDRAAHVIKICRNGLFANFHDSHSEDAFYLDEVSVRFEDIIECGPIYQVELDSLAWKKYTYTINTIDNKQVSITELDREFLFLYGLSILSSDMKSVPLPDEAIDIAVFSLSLMGRNWPDYVAEAKRCLATNGYLLIAETTKAMKGRLSKIRQVIELQGFDIYNQEERGDFTFIEAREL